MVRVPPLRLGISKILYLGAACLYKIYESPAGLNRNSFAKALSDAVDLRLASLDMRYEVVTHPALLREDTHHVTRNIAITARAAYCLTFASNATKHGTKSAGWVTEHFTICRDLAWLRTPPALARMASAA